MEALNPKTSPRLANHPIKETKPKKNLWEIVKSIFTDQPEPSPAPKKDYSNYKTEKLLPENAFHIQKRIPESQHIVYRDHKKFETIDEFHEFLRTTKPIPQTINQFHEILKSNALYLIQRDHRSKTSLRVAVESNNEIAVDFFLNDLLHFIAPYQEIHTQLVLFKAIENKNIRMLELMLQPGFIVYGEQFKMINERGRNAAEYAVDQYKKAPPEQKRAAWNVVYVLLPDATIDPPDFSS